MLAQLLRHYLGQAPAPATTTFWDHAAVHCRGMKPKLIATPKTGSNKIHKPVLKRVPRFALS